MRRKTLYLSTLGLLVSGFTMWGFMMSTSDMGRHLIVPILYLLAWVLFLYVVYQTREYTIAKAALIYWLLVLTVSLNVVCASPEIIKDYFGKHMTLPVATALMPFSGFVKPNGEGFLYLIFITVIISVSFTVLIALYIAYQKRSTLKVALASAAPVPLVILCMMFNINRFGEAFLNYLNDGGYSGTTLFSTAVSVIYIFIWIALLIFMRLGGLYRTAVWSTIFWGITSVTSLLFVLSPEAAVIPASFVLSPLFGFCLARTYPVGFGIVAAVISLFFFIFSYKSAHFATGERRGYVK